MTWGPRWQGGWPCTLSGLTGLKSSWRPVESLFVPRSGGWQNSAPWVYRTPGSGPWSLLEPTHVLCPVSPHLPGSSRTQCMEPWLWSLTYRPDVKGSVGPADFRPLLAAPCSV